MKKFAALLLALALSVSLFATHNRAGYIVYKHISGYTYEFYIWTFTYTLSPVDRDSLPVWWGDGTSSYVKRVKYWYLPDYYKKNLYVARHTYPGPGVYEIVMQDPNRNAGVVNIANSVNTVFAIKTILRIDPFLGENNSVKLSNYPLDKAAVGQLFIHNPGAYDIDGDSLVYRLDTCRYNNGKKIPWFKQPEYSDTLYVNPYTGDFVWKTPVKIGKYNVAMRIEEWRHGTKISYVLQDMQIEVQETDNHAPVIKPLHDTCVEAGDTLEFDVVATDQDSDSLMFYAAGLPFLVKDHPAQFYNNRYQDTLYGTGKIIGHFKWITTCSDARNQPYLVTFRVQDDNPEVKLVDYQAINIRVVPPGTKLVELEPSNATIMVKWLKNRCPNCIGYSVYRSRVYDNYDTTRCHMGIPPQWGYQFIGKTTSPTDTVFIDDNNGRGLVHGFSYCYRVVSNFKDINGYVSNNLCTELISGIPIITKVSVSTTDKKHGAIHVQWHPPLKLDSSRVPPPYRYYVYYSRDLYGKHYEGPIILNGLYNTSLVDSNINTVDSPSIYKVNLANYDTVTHSWQPVANASIASSPYLTLVGSDRKITLHIHENVPWLVDKHVIYKLNPNTNQFDSIGWTEKNVYTDYKVLNGKFYSYKVKTIGHYTSDSLPRPLVNWSQIATTQAVDTIPPLCPIVKIKSMCDSGYNIVSWHMPTDSSMLDVKEFKIYYRNNLDSSYQLLATVNRNDTTFIHRPKTTLAACYIVTAVDSAGNESHCQEGCLDVCHYYRLPNAFTPNGDGINDIFHPYPYKFVVKVNMKIYNRWGDLVFQTTNPDINWDGTDMRTGKPVPDGVYYYICDVYERRLTGIEPRNIAGFIHVFRNVKSQKH